MLEEQEGEWKLTVHPKGLDVLLDSLPVGIFKGQIALMDKILRWHGDKRCPDRGEVTSVPGGTLCRKKN